MFRLRRKESDMVFCSFRYLSLLGLLGEPQEYGRAHLVRAVDESRQYVWHFTEISGTKMLIRKSLAMGPTPDYESRR